MAYEEFPDGADQSPALTPTRRSVDDDTLGAEYDQREARRASPPSGGCSRGCLFGLAGCGCLTVILMAVGGFFLVDFFRNAASTDPVKVAATTSEIADFDIPATLKPKLRMNMVFMKMVVYASDDGESALNIVEFDTTKLPGGNNQQVGLNQETSSGRRLEIVKSELKEMQIRGENAKVTFAEAKDTSNGRDYRVVKAKFKGKAGPAEFELQLPADKYKDEDVKKFIDQIK